MPDQLLIWDGEPNQSEELMPIFEYSCRKCNHRFETVVLSASEKNVCPKCQSSALEKQLSVFSSPASAQQASGASKGCACTPKTCGCH